MDESFFLSVPAGVWECLHPVVVDVRQTTDRHPGGHGNRYKVRWTANQAIAASTVGCGSLSNTAGRSMPGCAAAAS